MLMNVFAKFGVEIEPETKPEIQSTEENKEISGEVWETAFEEEPKKEEDDFAAFEESPDLVASESDQKWE